MAKFIGVYYIWTHNIRSGLILKRKLLNCREPHISDAINKINLSDSPRGFESSARLKKTYIIGTDFTAKNGCRDTLYMY